MNIFLMGCQMRIEFLTCCKVNTMFLLVVRWRMSFDVLSGGKVFLWKGR